MGHIMNNHQQQAALRQIPPAAGADYILPHDRILFLPGKKAFCPSRFLTGKGVGAEVMRTLFSADGKSNKCRFQIFRRNKILPAYGNKRNDRKRIGHHLVKRMLDNFKLPVAEMLQNNFHRVSTGSCPAIQKTGRSRKSGVH